MTDTNRQLVYYDHYVSIATYYKDLIMRVQLRLGTIVSGHRTSWWAQTCRASNVSVHKHVWAQTCLSTNVSEHKCVWTQTCLSTNVSGHKRIWAQTCPVTNVSGRKHVWA